MTEYPTTGRPTPDPATPSRVDAATMWSGGAATALVAALGAVAALVVCAGVFDVHVIWRGSGGDWSVVSAVPFALGAALAALAATGLAHLLFLTTPQPGLFYGWIMFLIAVIVAVLPFTVDARQKEQIASAIVNVALTALIAILTQAVAARSLRRGR